MTDDDELFRHDLRRAVATADVDDAWGTIARRVRVQRAGRATARVGIPVVTAALLVGGLVALTQRGGRDDRPADTSTTAVAVTTTPASTSPPTTPTTPAPPASSVTVVPTADPATWTWQTAEINLFGEFDVAAIAPDDQRTCVAVRPTGATAAWIDACGARPFFAVGIVDDRLVVVGRALEEGPVPVATSVGSRSVATVTVGDAHVYGFALPAGVELKQVSNEAVRTDCSYRPVLAAIAAAGTLPRGGVRIERCVGGSYYGSVHPAAVTGISGLVGFLVGTDDIGMVSVLASGDGVCQPGGTAVIAGAAATACSELGFTDVATTGTTVTPIDWPSTGTATVLGAEVDVRAAEEGGLVCLQARPTDGTDGGNDTCVDGDSFAVVEAGSRLVVVGTRVTAETVTMRTTEGEVTVPTFPFAGRRVFAAVLPPAVDLVSAGSGDPAAECPYRELYAALDGTSWVGPGAGTGMSVQRCRNGVAFVGLSSGHGILQGASAIFERVDGGFRAINLGGDLCNRTIQPPTAQAELAACAKVGF